MEYHMYKELCDRINELLEERRSLLDLIDTIPKQTMFHMIKTLPLQRKYQWLEYLKWRRKIK